MPLAKTAALVDERRAKIGELDRQLEQLSNQVPRKRKELERLQAELVFSGGEAAEQHSGGARSEEEEGRQPSVVPRMTWKRGVGGGGLRRRF